MALRAMKQIVEKLYSLLIQAASSLQSVFLLFVRVYWGWQFHVTGRGKIHDPEKVINYFTSLGIPAPALNAYFVSWLEFIGGFLLIVGVASRPIALLLAIDMVVAYVVGDREALMSIFSDPDKFYAAAPYTFLVASLIILIFGPGKASADAILSRFSKNK
jgi:putative oxidoreductase